MNNIIIIGGGPSGATAAIYLIRAGYDVLLIHNNSSKLNKDFKIENYYGFPGGIDSNTLYQNGISQVKRLGGKVIEDEVVEVDASDNFRVITTKHEYLSKYLILATGLKVNTLNIEGLRKLEGHGVSYCATCDGFFFRNKKVVVIGDSSFAFHEAEYLSHLSDVYIASNGHDISNTKFKILPEKIAKILGDDKVSGIEFEDGSIFSCDGIFIAVGSSSTLNFAKEIGISLNGYSVNVDDKYMTNVPNLYAIGDASNKYLQVIASAYSGFIASQDIIAKDGQND